MYDPNELFTAGNTNEEKLMNHCVYDAALSMAQHMKALKNMVDHGILPKEALRPMLLTTMIRRYNKAIDKYGSIDDALAAFESERGTMTFDEVKQTLDQIGGESLGEAPQGDAVVWRGN